MRHFKLINAMIFVALLTITFKTHAEVIELTPAEQAIKVRLAQAERLDGLFDELKREPDFNKSKRLASRIAISWSSSGSPTANALMVWAQQAMRDGRNTDAIELLNKVVELLPDYAEGYNRRATVYYVMKNYTQSMADIEMTLAHEPRHFGAMVGMAQILAGIGEQEKAVKVYERILSIYPAHRNAQASMIKLVQKLEQGEI